MSGSVEMLNGPTIQVPFQKHLLSKIYQEKMLALDNDNLWASLFLYIYILGYFADYG